MYGVMLRGAEPRRVRGEADAAERSADRQAVRRAASAPVATGDRRQATSIAHPRGRAGWSIFWMRRLVHLPPLDRAAHIRRRRRFQRADDNGEICDDQRNARDGYGRAALIDEPTNHSALEEQHRRGK